MIYLGMLETEADREWIQDVYEKQYRTMLFYANRIIQSQV